MSDFETVRTGFSGSWSDVETALAALDRIEAEVVRLTVETEIQDERRAKAERAAERLRDQNAEQVAHGLRLAEEVERLRAALADMTAHAATLQATLNDVRADRESLEREVERLRANYDAKCAEFETAKEPVFAEGMRQGCEDLMMEAAKMADENERLRAENESVKYEVAANRRAYEEAAEKVERLRADAELARPVLEYVSRGRRFVGVEPYPDAQARRALGQILEGTSE